MENLLTVEFVFVDFVLHDNWRRGNEDHAIVILENLVSSDVRLTPINDENSFTSSTVDVIVYNMRINATFSTKRNIRLNIIVNIILLYHRRRILLNQNPLLKIFSNIIL